MRSSGILLPVSALPSDFGIGTMGEGAHRFIDFLCDSRQHYWQILPLGHTGFGDSPYQCFSAFAGNPYLIDPELLFQSGYIKKDEVPVIARNEGIDYGNLYNVRLKLIKKAASNVDVNSVEFIDFERRNQFWLDDYALFMSVKEHEKMKPLKAWKEEIRLADADMFDRLREENRLQIRLWKCVQYLFFSQWANIKRYANARNVEIIGDVPIYVSADSCEMWTHRELFVTDDDGNPALFSGCPPDIYAPLGQLWGNPIYDWVYHRKSDYRWWIDRLAYSAEIFDVIRIDHFRGFEDFYAVESTASNAVLGEWYKGPSTDFFEAVRNSLPQLRVIAEDLGEITDDVRRLLEFSGIPGMKIMQFAFDGSNNEFLPHNYSRHCVAYTGTHDNPTMKQWTLIADDEALTFAKKYLAVNKGEDLVNACIRALFQSVCDTVIIPMQDWLGLGSEARINVPSTSAGNWTWRMTGDELTDSLTKRIAEMTKLYFRNIQE
ncbi:MAG: 4-alpha-glucanotransferase [Clostridia bacterium]|nr:4-alpha-glucanotransferase [Clostridia bacterium]